jgi:hypothetical protein
LDADRQSTLLDGQPLLDPALATRFDAYIKQVGSSAPDARSMAEQADQHWAPIITELDLKGRSGFGGLYLLCFRQFSAYVHPTTTGLMPFITDSQGGLAIGRPLIAKPGSCVSAATITFSLQLWVAARAVGWPDTKEIDAIHSVFPASVP